MEPIFSILMYWSFFKFFRQVNYAYCFKRAFFYADIAAYAKSFVYPYFAVVSFKYTVFTFPINWTYSYAKIITATYRITIFFFNYSNSAHAYRELSASFNSYVFK